VSECEHDWRLVRDLYGADADGNRGVELTYFECRKCGETRNDVEDWEDPRELAADDERDRRIDDELTGDT
jgi:hypothetical protein